MINSIVIKDNGTNKSLELSYSEFVDLTIGLECAKDTFSRRSRISDFNKLIKKLQKVSSYD